MALDHVTICIHELDIHLRAIRESHDRKLLTVVLDDDNIADIRGLICGRLRILRTLIPIQDVRSETTAIHQITLGQGVSGEDQCIDVDMLQAEVRQHNGATAAVQSAIRAPQQWRSIQDQWACHVKSCMGDAIMRDSCSADIVFGPACAVGSSGVARCLPCSHPWGVGGSLFFRACTAVHADTCIRQAQR